MTFLGDCAGTLNDQQFGAAVDFLAARQEQARNMRRARQQDRDPDQFRDRIGRGWMDSLGLTQEQAQTVHQAMMQAREQLRTGRDDYDNGNADAAQVRERARLAVETLRGQLQGALTPEQYNGVVDRTRDRQWTTLGRILGLSETQADAVQNTFREVEQKREALRKRIQAGEIDFPDAVYESLQIHEQHREAMGAVLDEGQRGRLERLRNLHRGGRGGPGFQVPLYL